MAFQKGSLRSIDVIDSWSILVLDVVLGWIESDQLFLIRMCARFDILDLFDLAISCNQRVLNRLPLVFWASHSIKHQLRR